MPRRKGRGKGSGIVSTVAQHGKRITKLESTVAEQTADINHLVDIVVEVQEAIEPTAAEVKPAAGTKPKARRKRSK